MSKEKYSKSGNVFKDAPKKEYFAIQSETKNVPVEYELFKKRWLMLGILVFNMMNGGFQWTEFTVINGLVSAYYNVTPYAVDWTAEGQMLFFLFGLAPSVWLLDKLGIRYSIMISAIAGCVSSWIKVASVSPERFYILLCCQCIAGFAQAICCVTAPRLAAVWFGAAEIALAGCLTLVGDQLGSAIGFFIPAMIVTNSNGDIGSGLFNLNMLVAISSTTIFILCTLFLESGPPTPPSAAQVLQTDIKKKSVLESLKTLLKNGNFVLMSLSYSVSVGCYGAFAVGIGQVFDVYFEDSGKHAGTVGMIMVLCGSVASIVVGHFMDRTHKFKETAVFCSFMSFVTTAAYAYVVMQGNYQLSYCLAVVHGFFFSSYYVIAFQLAIELAYPISEDIILAVSLVITNIVMITFSNMYGIAIRNIGPLYANMGLCVLLLLSCCFSSLVPKKTKRQEAEKVIKHEESLETFLSS